MFFQNVVITIQDSRYFYDTHTILLNVLVYTADGVEMDYFDMFNVYFSN